MSLAQGAVAYRRSGAAPRLTGPFLALTGLVVWSGLSAWEGMDAHAAEFRLREAWDTGAYFYLGVPLMALAVGLAAYHAPRRAWRWPLWLVGGHQAGVLLVGLGMQSGLSLFILTLALAIVLAVIFAVPALAGSMMARRVMQRSG